jgi:hypothetical protein
MEWRILTMVILNTNLEEGMYKTKKEFILYFFFSFWEDDLFYSFIF